MPPCVVMHRKTSMGLKMTGRWLTITHKPLTPCSHLYPALFSVVLLSFPLLTGPLTTAIGVINCIFCNKMPFNRTLLFEYFFFCYAWYELYQQILTPGVYESSGGADGTASTTHSYQACQFLSESAQRWLGQSCDAAH